MSAPCGVGSRIGCLALGNAVPKIYAREADQTWPSTPDIWPAAPRIVDRHRRQNVLDTMLNGQVADDVTDQRVVLVGADACDRYRRGLIPNSALNARLKAARSVNPQR